MYKTQRKPSRHTLKLCVLSLGIILGLTACTNSSFALKLLYGQLDTLLNKELLDYADFNQQQEAAIRSAVDRTAIWHRQEELPRIAELISELNNRLLKETIDQEDIRWLFRQMKESGQRFEHHSPILALAPMLANLSDAQAIQVNQHLDDEMRDFAEENKEHRKKDAAKEASKSFSNFMQRLGLKMNRDQIKNSRVWFAKRNLSRDDFYTLERKWTTQFQRLLNNRNTLDFIARFKQHHLDRITQTQRAFPHKYALDQEVYLALVLELMHSLSEEQKKSMSLQLLDYRELAVELANSPS